jgi:hypothetical protein
MTIQAGQKIQSQDVLNSTGRLAAQLGFTTIRAAPSNWANEDYVGADIFNDSTGQMNTVDTGSSTAYYNTSSEYYTNHIDDQSSTGTAVNSNFSNTGSAFDGDPNTYASFSTATGGDFSSSVGMTFSSATTNYVRYKGYFSVGQDGGTVYGAVQLQKYTGSTWTTVDSTALSGAPTQTLTVDKIYELTESVGGLRVQVTTGANGNSPYSHYHRVYALEYGDYQTTSTVETDTIIDEVVPKSVLAYGDIGNSAGTSITYDISQDGGSSWEVTGSNLNEAADTSAFTGTDLALKFHLNTTDSSEPCTLSGYGVAVTDA